MWIRLNQDAVIEDLGNHAAESVEKLRALLASGARAQTDPQRRSFYEVENGSRIYYIHVCPNGKVLLLAVWPKETVSQRLPVSDRASASASM
ncbi:MAG: hypothetical protein ACRD3T_04670 [Terriglobia bacterium]